MAVSDVMFEAPVSGSAMLAMPRSSRPSPAFVGDGDVAVFLIDHKVRRLEFSAARSGVHLLALFELGMMRFTL